ncbi:hypothetical protein PQE75_gp077 [Bacillus phage vB_BcoS-136]|uniref:Uncharacterized protein n=1 Tax=Bacillus phage vB_BcoS-136 TaxID=2419619 RepID=A0A3G3BVD0_9CAUD|nr:hypothetical protein PQE75_gp077 [Bacillus phage vB_BcoS-136]AYP68209.1 hypothetical protein vBBcoS136_00077 [Bacillus phage vB_BcoS-136]
MSDELNKKILEIRKGEYLLEIRNNAVVTTYNQDIAMDISDWKWEQVEYIVSNLVKVGYSKCKVITIEGDDSNE